VTEEAEPRAGGNVISRAKQVKLRAGDFLEQAKKRGLEFSIE